MENQTPVYKFVFLQTLQKMQVVNFWDTASIAKN